MRYQKLNLGHHQRGTVMDYQTYLTDVKAIHVAVLLVALLDSVDRGGCTYFDVDPFVNTPFSFTAILCQTDFKSSTARFGAHVRLLYLTVSDLAQNANSND